MMTRRLSLLVVLLASAFSAVAQTSPIVGAWKLAAADKLLPNGARVSDYGANPQGLIIFTANGYYSVQIYRAEQVKFVSGDKLKGTPEEYKGAVLSSSVHFGRYSVDAMNHTITFQVEKSVFPNWNGTTQVRPYELKGDELSWKGAPRPDGSIPITVIRRAKGKAND
jgi:hypothetical protein